MAKTGYVGVNGSAHKIKSMLIGINGQSHKVKAAYIGVDGKARQWYQSGLSASSLAVGSSVYLNEGGSYVEYLVVNQGIPQNSSLYDSSCDGTWLLRKDCHSKRQWNSSDNNAYGSSVINTWLNDDFFNGLGAIEQAVIKQVKIPYVNNTGASGSVVSGANGLPVKAFLLGGYEVGYTTATHARFFADGSKLDYFIALSDGNPMRRAYIDGSAVNWWLRTPYRGRNSESWNVVTNGSPTYTGASTSYGIRPALILSFTATFDPATMRLIG